MTPLSGPVAGVGWDRTRHLLSRADFVRVSSGGARLEQRHVLGLHVRGAADVARVGLTVSRKVGGSVVRNRVRRWLREAMRVRYSRLPRLDLVLVARRAAANAGLAALSQDVERLVAVLERQMAEKP